MKQKIYHLSVERAESGTIIDIENASPNEMMAAIQLLDDVSVLTIKVDYHE